MHGQGTVPPEIVAQTKERFPNATLFKKPFQTPRGKDEFLCRCIDMGLQELVQDRLQAVEAQGKGGIPVEEANQMIFDYCVIWPQLDEEELDGLPYGMVPALVKVIQERSGYVDITITGQALGPDVTSVMIQSFPHWGDISKDEVTALKADSRFPLYKITIDRKYIFVIRPLTRTDMIVAQAANDRHISYAKSVTMWPAKIDFSTIPAGILDTLGQAANGVSGWDSSPEIEEI